MSEELESQENQSTPPQQTTPPPTHTPFPPSNAGMYGIQQTLPNSTVVLVLGILSIVLCCCYGILGLIPAIIALILSKKDRVAYAINPALYTLSSYKNLNAGRVCAIIGLVLNILSLLYFIFIIVMFGTGMLSDPQKLQEMIRGMQ